MSHELRLFEDIPAAGEHLSSADDAPRALYVASGMIQVGDDQFTADNGVVAPGRTAVVAGAEGATIWRWELRSQGADWPSAATRSMLRLTAEVDTTRIADDLLMRLDSVSFPPSGTAMLHTHQGPGIRCLREGTIRIDTGGHCHTMAPGSPWFEAGPEPVFAQADVSVASRFIRVMILPAALLGQSSIRYVNEEDKTKPKSQTYRVYHEALISV